MRAFTLVEILIVVVILGILAALVVPNFANATTDARINTTYSELEKLRRAIDVYHARNNGQYPSITLGDWGTMTSDGEYLSAAPRNAYVGGTNATQIILGTAPDTAFQTTHGWIYNATTGEIWAGSFDADDRPIAP